MVAIFGSRNKCLLPQTLSPVPVRKFLLSISRSCDRMQGSSQHRSSSAWRGPKDYARDPRRERMQPIPTYIWHERFSELAVYPEKSHYTDKRRIKSHVLATTELKQAERNFTQDSFFAYDLMISKDLSAFMRHDATHTAATFSERARYWDIVYNLVGLEAGDSRAMGMIPGCIPIFEISMLKNRTGRLIMSDPDLLEFVVTASDKQRFHVEVRDTPEDSQEEHGPLLWFICSNQGHSAKLQRNMVSAAGSGRRVVGDEDDLPAVLYHATTRTAASQILLTGYMVSDRVDIHFCIRPPNDPLQKTASSAALNKPVWIFVDIEKLLRAEVPLYISKNDVALVRTVDGKLARGFIKEVINHNTEYSLLTHSFGTAHADVRMCLDAKHSREPDFREANHPESVGMPSDVRELKIENEVKPTRSDIDRLHERTRDFSVEQKPGHKTQTRPESTLPVISETAPAASSSAGTQYFSMETPVGSPRSYGPSTPYVEEGNTLQTVEPSQPLPAQTAPAADPVIKEEADWEDDSEDPTLVQPVSLIDTSSVDTGSYIKIDDLDSLKTFSNAPSVVEVDDLADDDAFSITSIPDVPDTKPAEPTPSITEPAPSALTPYSKLIAEGWVPVWQGGYIVGIAKDGTCIAPPEGNPAPVPKKRQNTEDDSSSDQRKKKKDNKGDTPSGSATGSSASASERVPTPAIPWKPPWGSKPGKFPTFNHNFKKLGGFTELMLRPGEWITIQPTSCSLSWLDSGITFYNASVNLRTPSELRWDRIFPCNTCGRHLAPACAVCHVSCCRNCTKELQFGARQNEEKTYIMCACAFPFSDEWKNGNMPSEVVSPELDMVWDEAWPKFKSHLDPDSGMLLSPCGRTAPSPFHRDRPPRLPAYDRYSSRRKRSRTPLQRKRSSQSQPAAAPRKLPLKLIEEFEKDDKRSASQSFYSGAKARELSVSAFRRPKSPPKFRVTLKNTVSTAALDEQPTIRPDPYQARMDGVTSAINSWDRPQVAPAPAAAAHRTPNATSLKELSKGSVGIAYVSHREVDLEGCRNLNETTGKPKEITLKIGHSDFTDDEAYDFDFISGLIDKVAACNWASGMSKKAQQFKFWSNHSSYQVTAFASNFGDMANRKVWLGGTKKLMNSFQNQFFPLLRCWASVSAHVWITAEAEGLDDPKIEALTDSEYNLRGMLVYPDKDSFCNAPAVACHIKNHPGSEIKLLHKSCVVWSDDFVKEQMKKEPKDRLKSWSFIGAIFEVTFGKDTFSQRPVHRAGFEKFTVAVFHLNQEAAKHPNKARKLFMEFVYECLRNKVDYLAGDGNMAVNMAVRNQTYADRDNATLAVAVRQIQRAFNQDKEIWERLSVYPVEGETALALAKENSRPSDLDCMIGWAFGWSKGTLEACRRHELSAAIREIRQRKVNNDLAVKRKRYEDMIGITADEEDALDLCHPRSSEACLNQFSDLHVTVSEYFKNLTRHDLFLEETSETSGGGWHRPMLTTIRQSELKNQRKATGKSIYKNIEQKLSLAALVSKIVPSSAASAEDSTCSSVPHHDEENDEHGGHLLLYILFGSLLLNLILMCILFCRCRRNKNKESKNQAVRAEIIDAPIALATQGTQTLTARPYFLQARQQLGVCTYPTGTVYHFHPRCQFHKNGKFFLPCKHCIDFSFAHPHEQNFA